MGEVLSRIGERFDEELGEESEFFCDVNIGKEAEELGYPEVRDKYQHVDALVPLKKPLEGMKVRIDGRTFLNYAQLESGIVVPGYVAKDAGLPYKTYEPHDSMIRVFA